MKLFISWSGTKSKLVAAQIKRFIKSVIQATKPWMSSEDLERGTVWFTKIYNELGENNLGIVCLTKENMQAPWILFECGALLKGLQKGRIFTILIDLEYVDLIHSPLEQFNHTKIDKTQFKQLVVEINDLLPDSLDQETLYDAFELHWPIFEEEIKNILATTKPAPPSAKLDKTQTLLTEIYMLVRNLDNRVHKMENKVKDDTTSAAHVVPRILETSPEKLNSYIRFIEDNHHLSRSKLISLLRTNFRLPSSRAILIVDDILEKMHGTGEGED